MIDGFDANDAAPDLWVATFKMVPELRFRRAGADDEQLLGRLHLGSHVVKEPLINWGAAIATDPCLEVQLVLGRFALDNGCLSAHARQVVGIALNESRSEQRQVHHGGLTVINPYDGVLILHDKNLHSERTATRRATTTAKGHTDRRSAAI